MRKWNFLSALLAVALLAPAAFGQTQEDLLRKLDALDKRVKQVEQENIKLKAQIGQGAENSLEAQVNSLMDRYAAGTVVNSVANPVTLTGEFRIRNTWTIGNPVDPTTDDIDGGFTDARIRLGFQYEFTKDVTAFVELQSHFTFGDSTSSTYPRDPSPNAAPYGFFHGEVGNSVAAYQGWIEVKNLFNQPQLSAKWGRQEIVLGNQFQFGNADWFNGFTFDAATFRWEDEAFSLTGIVATLSNTDHDLNQQPSISAHDDDEIFGLYFTVKSLKDITIDLYWFYLNGHGTVNSVSSLGENLGGGRFGANAFFHTLGARIAGNIADVAAGLDWNIEGAFETGNSNGTAVNDISDFSIEAEVGLTLNKDNKIRIYARGLFAEGPSGNDPGYIPLFPNRHSNSGFRARYGIFDLLPLSNVLSIQGGASFDPDPDWTVGAGLIYSTTDNQTTGPGRSDDYGVEADGWVEYRYSDQLTLGAGLAVLFPDDELVALTGLDDSTQYLIYLQARLIF